MAPKGLKREEEQEEPFQAVVIDVDQDDFEPFTSESPKSLLPLANKPLIEYTLEYLESAGVSEIYFYGSQHIDQIEKYLESSRWRRSTSPFKKFVVFPLTVTSWGDAMRDLDQRNLIAGDFLAVSCDIISDFPIYAALREHKERRQKDKNAIMTMLLRQNEWPLPPHGNNQDDSDNICEGSIEDAQTPSLMRSTLVFTIDPLKKRCLQYQEKEPGDRSGWELPPLDTPEAVMHPDLVDCRIDICSPDVLGLWSDNFDNQTPRRDFLHNVLKDYELNGKTVHTHIITDRYAARIADLDTYESVSQDLNQGTSAILSLSNDSNFKRSRNGMFLEKDTILARPCHITLSAIGKGTSVGAGSSIRNSFVGRHCHIGKNVEIRSAYIWRDVTISDNAKINRAIIADEAFVGQRASIQQGTLVSYGASVEANANISPGTKVTKGEIDSPSDAFTDPNASIWYPDRDYADSVSSLSTDASEDISIPSQKSSRSPSFAGATTDFDHEAVTSLFERMQENSDGDNVRLEFAGLRSAENATDEQARRAVAVAMMKHIQHVIEHEGVSPADASRRTLSKYRVLIQREKQEIVVADQVDFLMHAQRDLVHRSDGARILLFVTKDLYDLEIFGEEVFTQWWGDGESHKDEGLRNVREQTAQFIEWLQTAESEESDEEEESEEDV